VPVKVKPQVKMGIERRKAIMSFIREYIREYHYAPSQREIAEGVGIAKTAATRHLDILVEEGKLEMTPGVYRSVRPVPRRRTS